jgi:ACS family glucarate transporter-like MFS transporter
MLAPGAQTPTRTRYQIIALIFLVTTLNYADRATFSIAGSAAAKELALTPVATGYVLSAFAWAYALAQIRAGPCWTVSGPSGSIRSRLPAGRC